jgi:hypothetical protein
MQFLRSINLSLIFKRIKRYFVALKIIFYQPEAVKGLETKP